MERKNELYTKILDWAQENNNTPSYADLISLGISRDMIRHHWGNLQNLKQEILQDVELFSIHHAKPAKIGSKRVFVITSVVSGLPIYSPFLDALNAFVKHYNAELLLLPIIDPKNEFFDPKAQKHGFITKEQIDLNKNLKIINLHSPPKAVDITSNLGRISHKFTSIILPSTKLRLQYVAIPGKTLPRAIMSPGCINLPKYVDPNKTFPTKTNFIANNDHSISALVVEIENEEYFHFRQLIPDSTGAFADLGLLFTPEQKIKKIEGVAVLGDWHVTKTDLFLRDHTIQLLDKLNIKLWVMHDVFDGDSISHHDIGNEGLLARKALEGRLSLERELQAYANELFTLAKNRQLVIVKSNHDEHLERYLSEARYIKHPYNHKLCLELSLDLLSGKNPLEEFTKRVHGELKQITWLKRDESYKYQGIELGAHGDRGANGAKATIRQMENSYGSVVFGHTHTPQILRSAWAVGTSTDVKPDYGTGPSSWVQTHCLIYENGSRQLINFINNKFTTLVRYYDSTRNSKKISNNRSKLEENKKVCRTKKA